MYLHDKKPNPDYWMKSVVNEKINNLGKSKLQIKNNFFKNKKNYFRRVLFFLLGDFLLWVLLYFL